MKIILATTSPYRIALMKTTGIPFEAKGSNVDEYHSGRPTKPEELVKHLSKLKAEAVAKDCIDSLVIGFDSVGYFDGEVLEKPQSYEEALERLKGLSGKEHEFYTGVTAINTADGSITQKVVKTTIKFRDILEKEIKDYLDNDTNFNTYALGYDPYNGISSTFIDNLEGDPMNLMQGIPVSKVIPIMRGALE